MSLPIEPIGNKIIVVPVPPKETTIRGIIIPLSVGNGQLEEGIVQAVAPDVGDIIQVGHRVLYPKGAGVEHEQEGVKYKFINGPAYKEPGDIWAIITKQA